MSKIIGAHKIIGVPKVYDIFGGIAVWKGEQTSQSHVAMFDRGEKNDRAVAEKIKRRSTEVSKNDD